MDEAKPRSARFVTAVAVFYIFLWASAYVPSKVASVESSPLWFLVVRFLTAGTMMVLLAVVLRRPFPRTAKGWLAAASLGITANALYLGLTYLALEHMSSGMGALIASTNPLVLALAAPFALKEPLRPLKAAGLVLGFAGVLVVVFARYGTPSGALSDVALAFAGVCASVLSTILYKRLAVAEDLVALSSLQLLSAGIAVAPIAFLAGGVPHVVLSAPLVASFVYLVLVLSIGATLIWFWLLGQGEASKVSAYYYLTPGFGLALAGLILHEHVSAGDLGGLVLIGCGITLVQRS